MITDQSLDAVLVEVGELGRYQVVIFILVSFGVILHTCANIAYVFTAKDIAYRCEIPECESNPPQYETDWLKDVVPFNDETPEKCRKFQYINTSTMGTCHKNDFNQSMTQKCDNFIFKSREKTIVNEFGLYCEENLWKLTLVGTINNIGQLVGLPLSGIASDRFGRRTTMIWAMFFCAIAGIAKMFTSSYVMFLVGEFIDAAFQSGVFACGYILAVELVGPKKRGLASSLICYCFSIGEIVTAGVAWLTLSWKLTILITYTPSFLLLTYFWLIPESVRWLLVRGRHEEATKIMRKVAKFNKKTVSEESLEQLKKTDVPKESLSVYPIYEVFKSKILTVRFFNCCFCWISCAFLFYGMTLNSVALSDNSYFDFILTALVEFPAFFLTNVLIDRLGRRACQFGTFLITGLACLVSIFVTKDIYWLQLAVYMTGKFGASAAFAVCYVISSEIFPTHLRHSLMGFCSTIGRVGSIVAPQMPLLKQIWKPFPLTLFSVIAFLAAFMSMFFPETSNTILPDTIEEAENIGMKNKNEKKNLCTIVSQ